jgi:superfamily II DNA/RNA helicase
MHIIRRSLRFYGIAALAISMCGNTARSQPPKGRAVQSLTPQERKSLDDFVSDTKDYISKEHALPADKLKPTSDVAALDRERQALREALQQSRPGAKQGDLFSPPVADVFRKLLSRTLAGPDGAKIRASLQHAEPAATPKFAVNTPYPNGNGQPIQSVPPTVLLNLPILPKGLEYCVSGKTLALRDTDANLVVDFLPDALP